MQEEDFPYDKSNSQQIQPRVFALSTIFQEQLHSRLLLLLLWPNTSGKDAQFGDYVYLKSLCCLGSTACKQHYAVAAMLSGQSVRVFLQPMHLPCLARQGGRIGAKVEDARFFAALQLYHPISCTTCFHSCWTMYLWLTSE